jgi:membrane fusion protein (multidrug efflux system)
MSSGFARTTRSLARDTPALALLAWVLSALLLAAWSGWFFLSRVTVYEVSQRARLEVRQSAHPVAATVASKVLANRMLLGREVRAGEVLVELDASAEQGRVDEEQSRLAAYAPRLVSLQREIQAVQRTLGDDQQSFAAAVTAARARAQEAGVAADFARDAERRTREDNLAGGASQIDALRAGADARRLAAARDALLADVGRIEADAQARSHQQQAQIESLVRAATALQGEQATTGATLARLRQDVARLEIRAPVAGVLGDVAPLVPGSFVAPGQKLASVVPRGDLIIVAEFNPAGVLGRIQPGQLGRMRLDGFPWAEYGTVAARVSRVATEIRDQRVRVEFTPEPSPGVQTHLQHGLPGAIEVGIEQASPATLVLRAAGQLGSGGARKDGQSTAAPPT